MTDVEQYLQRAEEFTRLAADSKADLEREGYLHVAPAYASLAKDAATFAARFGVPLLSEELEQTQPGTSAAAP